MYIPFWLAFIESILCCVCVCCGCVSACFHKEGNPAKDEPCTSNVYFLGYPAVSVSSFLEELTLSRLCQRAVWITSWGNKLESRCLGALFLCL